MHFVVSGVRPAGGGGRAGDRAVAREVLLGDDHARQDGRDRRPATRSSRPMPARRSTRSEVVRGRRHHLGRPAASPSAPATGSGAAPARSAATAWPASSLFICATIAREARSPAGSRSRWLARCCSTWRSVSTTKPRLAASPSAAGDQADAEGARVPERIEQARAGAEFAQALGGPGEVVGFLARRPAANWRRSAGFARRQRLRAVERLGADLADVVDAHQGAGLAPLGVARAAASVPAGDGLRPRRPRRARERASAPGRRPASKRSTGVSGNRVHGAAEDSLSAQKFPRKSSLCQDNIRAFFARQGFAAPGPSGAIRTTSAEGVVPDLLQRG